MPSKTLRHEFKIVIEGIELNQTALSRLNTTLQKAFLTELLSLNIAGEEFQLNPIMAKLIADDQSAIRGDGDEGGTTGGAHIRAIKNS